MLCELVSSSFGEDGKALGAKVRECDGLVILSWLLLAPVSQKRALFLLGNLASDAVDSNSRLTKQGLLECGADARLLPCLRSDDDEVLMYACAALQNLCDDEAWSLHLADDGSTLGQLEVRTSGRAGGRVLLPSLAPPASLRPHSDLPPTDLRPHSGLT